FNKTAEFFAVLCESRRMMTDVRFGYLPAYCEAIISVLGPALIGGPVAANIGSPVDVQVRNSAIRLHALVTDVEAECAPVITRCLIIERGGGRPRMRDNRIAQNNPIIHPLSSGIGDWVFGAIALSACAVKALSLTLASMRPARRRRGSGAVAGLIDLDPDLIDCPETLFIFPEGRACASFEGREFQFVGWREFI